MSENPNPVMGKFVWHELMTTDVNQSVNYYTKLFGWTTKDVEMGPAGTYTLIKAGGQDIGGICNLDQSPGAPPHWIGYVSVADIEAAVAKVPGLGGKVLVPPTEIPEVGRFAVIKDPAGAAICPFQGLKPPPVEEPPRSAPGTFCWNELLTTDPTASARFYQGVFGWSVSEMDMGPMGTYWVFKRGDKDAAGMMKKPPEAQTPPFWLHYVEVPDVDATATQVREMKGTIHVEPRDIPSIGRFSVTGDSLGASIALFKSQS